LHIEEHQASGNHWREAKESKSFQHAQTVTDRGNHCHGAFLGGALTQDTKESNKHITFNNATFCSAV
jgi:hypothetical protein